MSGCAKHREMDWTCCGCRETYRNRVRAEALEEAAAIAENFYPVEDDPADLSARECGEIIANVIRAARSPATPGEKP